MADANCKLCGGSGWKTVEQKTPRGEARVAVRCDCTANEREVRIFDRAHIPRRYEHCDFENFETDLQHEDPSASKWNRSLEQAKIVSQAFARDFPVAVEHGLLFMGPCGAGKTHLAVAALKQIALRGHTALYFDYRDLLKQIQASYNPESQSSELEVLEPVLTCELLLLDDLGASKPSAWALETVGHILNTRYNEKRTTLITTNYPDPDGPGPEPVRFPSGKSAPRAEETLADRVGQRIRSRLYEMCRTVEIVSADYRKEVRQAGR
ncbi:MAG: ATP-binding protein [Acidobacteria bacterium]|nr:ATP-binding protein [Acidobacteriota bacterium]